MLRQKDSESTLMNPSPTRTSSRNRTSEGHDISFLTGKHTALFPHHTLNPAGCQARLQTSLDYPRILFQAALDPHRLRTIMSCSLRPLRPHFRFILLGSEYQTRLRCLHTLRRVPQDWTPTTPSSFGNSQRTCLIRAYSNTCTRLCPSPTQIHLNSYCSGSMYSSLIIPMQTGFYIGPRSFCKHLFPLCSVTSRRLMRSTVTSHYHRPIQSTPVPHFCTQYVP